MSILETCNLPTTYVDQVSPKSETRRRYFSEKDIINFYKDLSAHEAEFFENDPIFSDLVKKIKRKSKDENHLK